MALKVPEAHPQGPGRLCAGHEQWLIHGLDSFDAAAAICLPCLTLAIGRQDSTAKTLGW
jgi:hypothetical protein